MRTALALSLLLLTVAPTPSRAQDVNGNGIADRLELPGTQPTAALPGPAFSLDTAVNSAVQCQGCHTTANRAGPFPGWAGSMMGNAARDPVFWAQLDVAEADEPTDPSLVGARDLCLRCHTAKGWLEGRSSSAPLATALRGMAMQEHDLHGVQCAICHRLVDREAPDAIDALIHAGLNTHPDALLRVPPTYGNGMYILDRYDVRRGPFSSAQIGWPALLGEFIAAWPPPVGGSHPVKDSAFFRSGNLCGTCHDVSNPAWTPLADKGNVQQNFPIERTFTEWTHSAYPARGQDGSCQACHMNGVLNDVLAGGASFDAEGASGPFIHMNDVHFHDLTGGNVWVPLIISEMVQRFQATKNAPDPGLVPVIGPTQEERDIFLNANFARIIQGIYPTGSYWRPVAGQPLPSGFDAANYTAASDRAKATLQRAAQLSGFRAPGGDLKLRVWNMTGHKLPTGYPEGRRMWLDVKFLAVDSVSGSETLTAQSGEYDAATGALYHDFNLDNTAGPKPYDRATYTDGAGTPVAGGRRAQVYEARMHHLATGTEFHFIRNNERRSDNRVPPLGWVKAQYQANLAEQITPAAYAVSQMVYHDTVSGPAAMPPVLEETYNFDEVPYPVPAGCDVAEVKLWYQAVSREYMEELVAASPRTLTYPAGGGANSFTRADVLEYLWRVSDFGGQSRIPPVQMAKLRIALVDSDGDGLPDNWEIANGLNSNSAAGPDGRHGDPDADGRSNWLEFQNGTPANSSDAARPPLDLALVLDFSGSMNDLAPAGSNPKIQVLQDAVELFLKTWKQYAVKDDRIAIIYFASGVVIEGGNIVDFATLPVGATVESTIDDLISAVRAHAAGGSTAMGGGLQTALRLLTTGGAGHRKHVILFTNGMQNQSPMIRKNPSNNFVIQSEPVNPANGVYGDSGVTDAGGPAFGTAINTLSVLVHTVGIGVSETPDDRWQALLSGISANTGIAPDTGKNQFISRAFELEGAFINNLVEALRGFSPLMVRDYLTRLEPQEEAKTLEFLMDASASKATFILSWAGNTVPGRLRFELVGPDGKSATALARVVPGVNYQLAQAFFPLANALGRPVDHTGLWKMVVQREGVLATPTSFVEGRTNAIGKGPVEFRAYLVADVPDTSFSVRFSKISYRAGDEIVLTAQALQGFEPIRTLDKVTAEIAQPRTALGTRLAKTRFDRDQLQKAQNLNGDALADLAAAKSQLLLANPSLASTLRPVRRIVELFDDGRADHGDRLPRDGIFSARLASPGVPGLIFAEVTAGGQTARSRALTRHFTANAFIGNAPFSKSRSRIVGTRAGSTASGTLIRVRATPKDTLGNYLGPGYRDRLAIEIAGGRSTSAIEDQLDGSYTQTFELPSGNSRAPVSVSVDNESIFKGSVTGLLTARLCLYLLLLLALAILIWFALWIYRRQRGL